MWNNNSCLCITFICNNRNSLFSNFYQKAPRCGKKSQKVIMAFTFLLKNKGLEVIIYRQFFEQFQGMCFNLILWNLSCTLKLFLSKNIVSYKSVWTYPIFIKKLEFHSHIWSELIIFLLLFLIFLSKILLSGCTSCRNCAVLFQVCSVGIKLQSEIESEPQNVNNL